MLRAGRLLLALLPLALGIQGCVREPAPADRHFRLVAVEPKTRLARPGIAGTLIVDRPQGDALLAQRPIVFRRDADSPELAQHAYALWIDVPTAMLQHVIADHLDAAGVAESVLTADLGLDGEYVLRGRLVRFEHVRERDPSVEVELALLLSHRDSGSLLLEGRYAATRRLEDASMASVVAGLQGAAGEALDAFVADLDARTASDGRLPVPASPRP